MAMKQKLIEILNEEAIEKAIDLGLKDIPEPEYATGEYFYFNIESVNAFCISYEGYINLFISGTKVTVEYTASLEKTLKAKFK